MFILANLLGLKSKQTDITAAFLHATLGEGKKVNVEIPLGFRQHRSNGKFKVLCLKKSLYDLHQSPFTFWKYPTEKFGNIGLLQDPFDPLLFIGKMVIVIFHVRDLIFWTRNEKDILELAIELC